MKSSNTFFQAKHQYGKRERCIYMGIRPVPFMLSSLFIATIFSIFILYSPNPLTIISNQGLDPVLKQKQQQQHQSPQFDSVQKQQQQQQKQTQSPQGLDYVQKQPPPPPMQGHDSIHKQDPIEGHNSVQEQQQQQQRQRRRHGDQHKPHKKKVNCDFSKGHWVRESRGSFYTNSSCATIPDSKNCFKHGRRDMDFLNWRWKPDQCDLPRFDAKTFLQLVKGKTMAFIGDSVARNHMESLLCLLSQEEIPEDIYKDSEDRFRTWYFRRHDFTLKVLWTKFLVAGEEIMINGTGSSQFNLQLDKVDDEWTKHLPGLDYAIVSAAHWFFRVLYLHEGDNVVGCVYCNEPNVTHRDMNFALQMSFRATFNYINDCKNCSGLVTLLRTFAPAHFENGFWNTGGYCNRTTPSNENEIDLKRFEWDLRNAQVEEIERARKVGKSQGKKFGVVDVTRAMLMRPDGHPGDHWGNKWNKGYNDCVHWCMPGPVDTWSEIFMAVLREEAGLSS